MLQQPYCNNYQFSGPYQQISNQPQQFHPQLQQQQSQQLQQPQRQPQRQLQQQQLQQYRKKDNNNSKFKILNPTIRKDKHKNTKTYRKTPCVSCNLLKKCNCKEFIAAFKKKNSNRLNTIFSHTLFLAETFNDFRIDCQANKRINDWCGCFFARYLKEKYGITIKRLVPKFKREEKIQASLGKFLTSQQHQKVFPDQVKHIYACAEKYANFEQFSHAVKSHQRFINYPNSQLLSLFQTCCSLNIFSDKVDDKKKKYSEYFENDQFVDASCAEISEVIFRFKKYKINFHYFKSCTENNKQPANLLHTHHPDWFDPPTTEFPFKINRDGDLWKYFVDKKFVAFRQVKISTEIKGKVCCCDFDACSCTRPIINDTNCNDTNCNDTNCNDDDDDDDDDDSGTDDDNDEFSIDSIDNNYNNHIFLNNSDSASVDTCDSNYVDLNIDISPTNDYFDTNRIQNCIQTPNQSTSSNADYLPTDCKSSVDKVNDSLITSSSSQRIQFQSKLTQQISSYQCDDYPTIMTQVYKLISSFNYTFSDSQLKEFYTRVISDFNSGDYNNNYPNYHTILTNLYNDNQLSLAPATLFIPTLVSQPGSQSVYQPGSQSVCQPGSQPVCQPGSQPVCQPGSQLVSQPGSQPVYQPGSQPVSQPVYQPVLPPNLPTNNHDTLSNFNSFNSFDSFNSFNFNSNSFNSNSFNSNQIQPSFHYSILDQTNGPSYDPNSSDFMLNDFDGDNNLCLDDFQLPDNFDFLDDFQLPDNFDFLDDFQLGEI